MRSAARLKAAIEIIDARAAAAATDAAALERVLGGWARRNRYAGSGDRRAIADLVYDAVRQRSSRAASMGDGGGRSLILAGLARDGWSIEAIEAACAGGDRAPDPLNDGERERLARLRDAGALARMDPWVRCDWPEWLWPALAEAAADPEAEARRLAGRGAPDVRANALKADRAAAMARLAEEGVARRAGPLTPDAIRLERPTPMTRLAVYADGWIEPQDAASQAVARLAAGFAPETGRILDVCAGGGGKTLALAALRPQARLEAFDVDARRMNGLPERLARAGAVATILDRSPDRGSADVVLVDAPCSGAGAWSRAPDAKWAATPARLAALGAAQDEALRLGAAAVAPGGALVYATCSILSTENVDRVAAFLASEVGAGFAPTSSVERWAAAGLDGAPPEPDRVGGATLWPSFAETDGFYVAVLRRV